MTSAQGITFEVRPSAALTFLFTCIVAAGTVAPWPTALPPLGRLCLSLAALAFGAWRVARQRNPPVTAVLWPPEGAWRVVDRGGRLHAAEPRSVRVVGEWVCLRLFWQSGRADLVLGPDNMDAETLRILRVRLKAAGPL